VLDNYGSVAEAAEIFGLNLICPELSGQLIYG
jgi:hypothetical protein